MTQNRIFILSIVITLSLLGGTANADTKTATTTKSRDGYGYVFKDDPLSGLSSQANSPLIRVRARAPRRMLLRPRLQFVDTMLQSVESI